ncbi:MAG: hypothetical protein ACR2FQ_00725 [Pseudonocardiaceae bacterium]
MVGELIRLKLTIQRHSLSWKRVLGLVLGLLAAALTWLAVLLAAPSARADVLLLVLAVWLAGWVVGPILSSGAAVLRPEYFTLLPLDRRRLGLGLLASVFVGVGAAVTAAGMLAVVGYAVLVSGGAAGRLAAVLVGLLGAALLLVLIVATSRVAYALLGAAMGSRVGVEFAAIQYGLLIASLFAGWLVISPAVSAVPVFLRDGLAGPAVAVLGRLPTGWPLQAVDAAAAGDPAAALGWLGALGGLAALAVLAAVSLLTPYVGNRTARRRRRPLGSRLGGGRTPLGAVVGKELRAWWRDPWRRLEVRSSIWFGVFLAVYGVVAGIPQLAAAAGVAVALMVALSGANLFGQDGTALWQLVVGQSPRAVRADIRGRQLGLVVTFGLPAVTLSALLIVLTGGYDITIPVLAVIVALLGVGSGVAVVLSVEGVTPGVDPHRRVNATDAGENALAIQVALHATLLLVAPVVVMAVPLALGAVLPAWFGAATFVVAVLDAFLVGWVGGRIAAHRLGSRLPETFARLRYPGIRVAAAAGGGALDYLARQAESSAAAAAEAAKQTTTHSRRG